MYYLLKQLVPPIIHTLRWYSLKYGWKGDYASFAEANQKATGYNADHILNRIITTNRKIVSGEIKYERDGIVYEKPKMNFNILSSLLYIASMREQELCVLDFGGSLGTTYYHKAPYLSQLKKLDWCIVEQPNYVEAGRKEFETDQLHFYYTIEECLQKHKPDVILFCGVIQYIEDTYSLLSRVKNAGIPYLLFDFIAYNDEDRDRIAIQYVPTVFYGVDASYTCWFYNKIKMFEWLEQYYTMLYDFISEPDLYYLELKPFKYEGQLWKLN